MDNILSSNDFELIHYISRKEDICNIKGVGKMRKVERYFTFEELKSSEKKTSDSKIRLQRHNDFATGISEILLIRKKQKLICKPNKFEWKIIS